jgi:mycoredoxin
VRELFGSRSCPFTAELREDLEWRSVEFAEYDIESDVDALNRMLLLTRGERTIPVLLEDGCVSQIGFRGRGCIARGS